MCFCTVASAGCLFDMSLKVQNIVPLENCTSIPLLGSSVPCIFVRRWSVYRAIEQDHATVVVNITSFAIVSSSQMN